MLARLRGVARVWAIPQAWVLQARPIQAGYPAWLPKLAPSRLAQVSKAQASPGSPVPGRPPDHLAGSPESSST